MDFATKILEFANVEKVLLVNFVKNVKVIFMECIAIYVCTRCRHIYYLVLFVVCESNVTCHANGNCDLNGICECYSGFVSSPLGECTACSDGQSGVDCSISIISLLTFSLSFLFASLPTFSQFSPP